MMEKSTFVKLHRSITKWRWYKNQNTKALFIHLMILANVTDQPFEDITIKRGQVITSRTHLSRDTGLTEQAVRTALNHLKSTNEITISTSSKYTIITINNYDTYQKIPNNLTNNQPTNNQQSTSQQPQYKNDKKEKNIKNVKNEREDTPAQSDKQIFGEFENVLLTQQELQNLKQRYPKDYLDKIEHLSAYLASSGKVYNNHYAVLLQWLAEDLAKAQNGGGKSNGNQQSYVHQNYQRSYAPSRSHLQQERSYDLEELENEDYDSYLDNLMASIGR